MYVPAVLRPTEVPSRASPPKRVDSPDGHSVLSGHGEDGGGGSAGNSSLLARPKPVLRRMVTEEWLENSMGKVTGPPSRNHWKVRHVNIVLLNYTPCKVITYVSHVLLFPFTIITTNTQD